MGLGTILGEHQWKPVCPTFGSCVLRSLMFNYQKLEDWTYTLAGWSLEWRVIFRPTIRPCPPPVRVGNRCCCLSFTLWEGKCSTLQGRREFCRLALSNRKGKTVKVWKWPWMGLYKWSAAYSIFIFRVRMIWMLGRAKRKDLDNIHLYSLRRQDKKLRSPRYDNIT